MRRNPPSKRSKRDRRFSATVGLGLGGVVLASVLLGPPIASPRQQVAASKVRAHPGAANTRLATAPAPRSSLPFRNLFQPLVMPKSEGRFRSLGTADSLTPGGPGAADLVLPASVSLEARPATTASKEATAKAKTGPEYVGTAIVDGVMYGLIQDPRTGEGVFVRAGGTYQGYPVRRVTAASVEVAGPRGTVVLPKTSGTDTVKPRTTREGTVRIAAAAEAAQAAAGAPGGQPAAAPAAVAAPETDASTGGADAAQPGWRGANQRRGRGQGFGARPGQGGTGQGFPGQGFPDQGVPGQGFPGQGFPGQGVPGQGFPRFGGPGFGFPGGGPGGPAMQPPGF